MKHRTSSMKKPPRPNVTRCIWCRRDFPTLREYIKHNANGCKWRTAEAAALRRQHPGYFIKKYRKRAGPPPSSDGAVVVVAPATGQPPSAAVTEAMHGLPMVVYEVAGPPPPPPPVTLNIHTHPPAPSPEIVLVHRFPPTEASANHELIVRASCHPRRALRTTELQQLEQLMATASLQPVPGQTGEWPVGMRFVGSEGQVVLPPATITMEIFRLPPPRVALQIVDDANHGNWWLGEPEYYLVRWRGERALTRLSGAELLALGDYGGLIEGYRSR